MLSCNSVGRRCEGCWYSPMNFSKVWWQLYDRIYECVKRFKNQPSKYCIWKVLRNNCKQYVAIIMIYENSQVRIKDVAVELVIIYGSVIWWFMIIWIFVELLCKGCQSNWLKIISETGEHCAASGRYYNDVLLSCVITEDEMWVHYNESETCARTLS